METQGQLHHRLIEELETPHPVLPQLDSLVEPLQGITALRPGQRIKFPVWGEGERAAPARAQHRADAEDERAAPANAQRRTKGERENEVETTGREGGRERTRRRREGDREGEQSLRGRPPPPRKWLERLLPA